MDARVVDRLDPGGEQAVELGEVRDLALCELDQELAADRPEKPFDLALRGRRARRGVNQLHAQNGARAQQLVRHERGAAIDEDPVRHPTRAQP